VQRVHEDIRRNRSRIRYMCNPSVYRRCWSFGIAVGVVLLLLILVSMIFHSKRAIWLCVVYQSALCTYVLSWARKFSSQHFCMTEKVFFLLQYTFCEATATWFMKDILASFWMETDLWVQHYCFLRSVSLSVFKGRT